jgi:hypothetical protein
MACTRAGYGLAADADALEEMANPRGVALPDYRATIAQCFRVVR